MLHDTYHVEDLPMLNDSAVCTPENVNLLPVNCLPLGRDSNELRACMCAASLDTDRDEVSFRERFEELGFHIWKCSADAIPHYLAALELGLEAPVESEALAWLASSLYKTDSSEEALTRVRQSRSLASDEELIRFLARLEKRIQRRR